MDTESIASIPDVYNHPMAGHLGFLLRRVQLAVFADFQIRTAEFNLTPTEYSVLEVIQAEPDMQQNRLAEIISVKPANCVVLINGLEQRGLLDRRSVTPKPGRGRALALRLTPEGKKLLKKMNKRVQEHLDHLVRLLGGKAHEQLRQQLLALFEKAEHGLLG